MKRPILFFLAFFFIYSSVGYIQTQYGRYLNIKDLGSFYQFYTTKNKNYTTLYKNGHSIKLKNKSKTILVNNIKVFLNLPILNKGNKLYVSEKDCNYILYPLLSIQRQNKKPIRTIFIDPGHGGQDSGARRKDTGLQEKQFTLYISQILAQKLQHLGFRTYLSRINDSYPSFDKRRSMAKRSQADLIISIHVNSTTNPKVQGIETFRLTPPNTASYGSTNKRNGTKSYDKNHQDSSLFAAIIQNELIKHTNAIDRGVKPANLIMLKHNNAPSVLLELGFISNDTEYNKLIQANYQEKLIQAIIKSIYTFSRL